MNTPDNHLVLPFPLGAKVFAADVGRKTYYITCPECDGTRQIKVLTHTGEYTVPCEECYQFGEPTGKVRRDTIQAIPKEIILKDVALEDGVFTYFTAFSEAGKARTCYPANELFLNKEDCLTLCQKKRAAFQNLEDSQTEAAIRHNRKKAGFTYRYWKGIVAKLEKQLEYARNKCKLLKGN